MTTLKFSFNELPTMSVNLFEQWYDMNKTTLIKISEQLKSDLDGFAGQTGTNRITLITQRIKSKSSFIDKIRGYQQNPDKIVLPHDNNIDEYEPQDLVRDLIGARLVMFFDNDMDIPVNYFDVYPMFLIDEIKVYQVIPETSPLFNQRKQSLYHRLKVISKKTKIEEKPTAYESLHMIIRYNANYLAIRKLAELAQTKKKRPDYKDLLADAEIACAFPIEIQIRTILQHTWAQIEHNMNYSQAKRKGLSAVLDGLLREDFKCHKSMLNAAEHHQTIIHERIWNLKRRSPILKNIISGVDQRAKYFDQEDGDKLMNINSELHGESPLDAFNTLIDFVELMNNKEDENYFQLSCPEHIEPWGRQRLILLLFAFALQSQDSSVAAAAKNTVEKRVIGICLSKEREDLVISLYEHIRFIDTYFRWATNTTEEERTFVSDPLVFYRCAGAYIATHDYRRAIHMLREVVSKNYFTNQSVDARDGSILNKLHFLRRIGEYYFLACVREGLHSRSDLTNSYEALEEALKCKECPSDETTKELEIKRIIAQMIVTQFFRYVSPEENSMKLFRSIMNERLLNLFSSHFPDEWVEKSEEPYALLALAIVKSAENSLSEARKLASESVELIKRKKANPLYVTAFELVQKYLNSASTMLELEKMKPGS